MANLMEFIKTPKCHLDTERCEGSQVAQKCLPILSSMGWQSLQVVNSFSSRIKCSSFADKYNCVLIRSDEKIKSELYGIYLERVWQNIQ